MVGCGESDEMETAVPPTNTAKPTSQPANTPATLPTDQPVSTPTQETASTSSEVITVLYTNDEHGWMEGMSAGTGAAELLGIWQNEERYSPDDESFIILSGGDMWTGPAISTWFDGEGKPIFTIEVQALQAVLPFLSKPWLEIGVGSGRFARALGIEMGVDPSVSLLKMAEEREIKTLWGRGVGVPYRKTRAVAAAIRKLDVAALSGVGVLVTMMGVTQFGGQGVGVPPAAATMAATVRMFSGVAWSMMT